MIRQTLLRSLPERAGEQYSCPIIDCINPEINHARIIAEGKKLRLGKQLKDSIRQGCSRQVHSNVSTDLEPITKSRKSTGSILADPSFGIPADLSCAENFTAQFITDDFQLG